MDQKSAKMIKFEELAERRMNEALNKIRLIGNLSHTGNYEYSDTHAKQIVSALKSAVKDVENRFAKRGRADKDGFRFQM